MSILLTLIELCELYNEGLIGYFTSVWKAVLGGEQELATDAELAELKALLLVRVLNEKCGLSTYTFLGASGDFVFVKVPETLLFSN